MGNWLGRSEYDFEPLTVLPPSYLEYIDNDIMLFIGYYIDLQNNNDTEGMGIWKYIYSQIPKTDNKTQDENNIKTLLKSLPLFYLLSFLGSAHYKQK